jgi:site-specific DNA recombinase
MESTPLAMRICGYARVSSREQAENAHALQQQIQRLRDAGCEEVLWDVESGSHDHRREFRRILQLVAEQAVEEVVVTRLDRITRSPRMNLELCDLFSESPVRLRALDDAIDTQTPTGRFVFRMMGSLAGMEVERLSERVRHGQAYRRRQGRVVRSALPLGICAGDDGRPMRDDRPFVCHLRTRTVWSRAQVVELLAAWTLQSSCRLAAAAHREFWGLPITAAWERDGVERRGRGAVKQSLGIGQSSLSAQLRGAWWRGRTPWLEGQTHEAIIGPEQAAALDRRIAENRTTKAGGARGEVLPLSGMVRCACCGGRAHQRLEAGWQWFICGAARRHRTACRNHRRARVADVEAVVIEALRERAAQLAELALQGAPEEEREAPQVAGLREALAAAEGQYRATGLDAYQAVIRELGAQLAAATARPGREAEDERRALAERLQRREAWEGMSREDLRLLFGELVETVEIGAERGRPVERIVLRL